MTENEPTRAARLNDGVARSLDPGWITLARIAGWIRACVLSAAGFVACAILIVALRPGLVGLTALVSGWAVMSLALGILGHAWPSAAWRHASWRLDERGLEIRRGVLWQQVVHVPLTRVQHTDVVQGPLQRRFDLATLVVYTAGTHHAAVPLPGLRRDDAAGIRDLLVHAGGPDAV